MATKVVTLCIFLLGMFIAIPVYLLFMATEDFVAGTQVQSSIVLTFFSIGSILGMVSGPFLVRWIGLSKSMTLSTLIWFTSWLLVVVGDNVNTRVVGSFTIGMKYGLSTTLALSLMSLYDKFERNTSAYIAGNSVATFLVGFLYTGEYQNPCRRIQHSSMYHNY